jgi:hypothetical protein
MPGDPEQIANIKWNILCKNAYFLFDIKKLPKFCIKIQKNYCKTIDFFRNGVYIWIMTAIAAENGAIAAS